MDLLWRDVDEAKAKNAFRQALHRLRGALGDDLIPQDRERIKLTKTDRIAIDLDEFEQAAATKRFDDALRLASGEFLEGAALDEPAFDHWVEQERMRIRVAFRELLQDAITSASASGEWPEAVARSKRLMAVAPLDSSAAHLAATTLIAAGRRIEAQDLLRQFAARLDGELGLPLPPELQALTSRIERQERSTPRPQTVGAGRQPFVGREAELSQLLTLWRTLGSDAGAFVLIEGESGIGKTRLLREFTANAKALGPALVLSGGERSAGGQLPYGIFAEALRPLVRAKGILGASRHLLAEASRLLPELRDEIDLPAAPDIEDDAGRLRFFEGIAALIDAAAFEQPVALLLEDVHRIPPSSLDLLSYLAVRLVGSPVMLVVTMRPGGPAPVVLRLRALAQPSPDGAPPHDQRARFLRLAAVGSGLTPDRSPTSLVDVRSVMRHRVEGLSSTERRFLLALALIARAAQVKTVAAAAHIPESAANEAAHVLQNLELVEINAGKAFATPLATDIALELAGDNGRAFLAGWVAEALEYDGGASAELARLFALAGSVAKAFDFYRRAALEALGVAALPESVQFLSSARTFATSPAQQREIESLLSALGAGRRRIAAVPSPSTAPGPSIAPQPASPPGWRLLFPNWRLLLGGAVATLVISTIVLAARPAPIRAASRASSNDTLVIREGLTGRVRFVTSTGSNFVLSDRSVVRASSPPWLDSLSRPWIEPIAAPRGGNVAVARVTGTGSDVFVISADRRDSIPIILGRGDAHPLGWSPDGHWVLATLAHDTSSLGAAAGLRAYSILGQPRTLAIDTSSIHSVVEAVWSPDGSRIAWVARAGASRQLDVFASRADGSDTHNISHDPSDDYHIAWSSDGELLAFTSTRDGNAEIYAYSFTEQRTWRLTFNAAQDDRASFSRSGHLVAFESTRGGSSGIFVMPSLGGEARRVAAGSALTIGDWVSGSARFVDRVQVVTRPELAAGDSAVVMLTAFDQFDDSSSVGGAQWMVLDTSIARLSRDATGAAHLVAIHDGLARVAGSLGGWRADTAFVQIGNRPVVLLDLGRVSDWRLLGQPAPRLSRSDTTMSLRLNADREWESGALSRSVVPLAVGLEITADIAAPVTNPETSVENVSVALVAPEESGIDSIAPQFLRYAGFSWNAESGRFVYSVGRDLFTENIPVATNAIRLRIRIEADSTVSFAVNGKSRWRSTLRIQDAQRDWRANLWAGGRATGASATVTALRASLQRAPTSSR